MPRSARSRARAVARVLSKAASRRPGVAAGAPIQGARSTAGSSRVYAGWPKPSLSPGVVLSDWAETAWGSQQRQPRTTRNRVTR